MAYITISSEIVIIQILSKFYISPIVSKGDMCLKNNSTSLQKSFPDLPVPYILKRTKLPGKPIHQVTVTPLVPNIGNELEDEGPCKHHRGLAFNVGLFSLLSNASCFICTHSFGDLAAVVTDSSQLQRRVCFNQMKRF